jgi:hypothetical protein
LKKEREKDSTFGFEGSNGIDLQNGRSVVVAVYIQEEVDTAVKEGLSLSLSLSLSETALIMLCFISVRCCGTY